MHVKFIIFWRHCCHGDIYVYFDRLCDLVCARMCVCEVICTYVRFEYADRFLFLSISSTKHNSMSYFHYVNVKRNQHAFRCCLFPKTVQLCFRLDGKVLNNNRHRQSICSFHLWFVSKINNGSDRHVMSKFNLINRWIRVTLGDWICDDQTKVYVVNW